MPVDVSVCRKCKHHDCLVEVLAAHTDVAIHMVKCQKICKGPVVGVPVGGRMEWFARVSGVHELAGLVRLTRRGGRDTIPKPLRKHRVKKHSGRAPRT
jgi:hypothetical protein